MPGRHITHSRRWLLAALAAAVCAGGLLAFLLGTEGQADDPVSSVRSTPLGLECPVVRGEDPLVIEEISLVAPAPPDRIAGVPRTPDEAVAEKVQRDLPGSSPEDFAVTDSLAGGAKRIYVNEQRTARLSVEEVANGQWFVTKMSACAAVEDNK